MKHFFRGGIGLFKKWGHESFIHQSEKKLNVFRLSAMSPLGFLYYGRNDVKEGRCSEDRRSLRTTFGLVSPLLRPYTTDLPCFDHRFTTFSSGIFDENVMKRCSGGNETPKVVRSRYGSDEEAADLAPTVYQLSSTQVLPLFCFCSTSLGSAPDCAVMRLRSSSENYRSAIGESSEQGGTWLGHGRYQAGSFSAYSWPIGCFSFGLQPRNKPRTTEEQANKEQGKTKQSPKNKQGISKASVLSSNTLLIHCYYFEHTWLILRQYARSASAKLAEVIGNASGQRRTCLQVCSTAIRQLFGSCSAVRRSAVEAVSNTTRRSLEAVPNQSRSGAEGLPKSSRRQVEAESNTARSGCEMELQLKMRDFFYAANLSLPNSISSICLGVL
ncbi:hypothetical protein SAMN05660841_04307 [Sphingobacterium nematocida]|uniref:Uncharacterized protein n=1 Tax=Sphingobacterium nematocida TaxID=1513896 RepID=A0A1T5GRU6_9SPHI|nr:hypothetical protein [Sphingobacterium nematocida]SKC11133.1 hypothetical protein SAMN05660841_04307 [Sphingobacterium nematocida]